MSHRFGAPAAPRIAALLGVTVVLLLTACGHNDSKSSSAGLSQAVGGAASDGQPAAQSAAPMPTSTAAAAGAASAAAGTGALSKSGIAPAAQLQSRNIVRTATLSVEVRNVGKAADALAASAAGFGGRVDQDNRTQAESSDPEAPTAELVLRILPQRLDEAMSMADRLGHETSRTVRGEDVTASVADTGARVAALQTSVRRLQALLSSSATLPDLLSLESQLTQRQASLDSTVAQQRALSDQLSLASLTVTLTQPVAVLAKPSDKTFKLASFGGALAEGWNGLVVAIRVLLAGFGYALPFAVIAVALAVGALWLRRRRRPAQPRA